ncbi:unnamed protein product [Adineta steineri]|uniref:Uncharacterized protein n=1 Tax=Adineta steineri TaxID=433720 RepID=A0A814CL64_9BILA|nr:unnamed protein product [Adineta steineri]CAF0854257.1 unnamed protein product [Adineta steineri]CAF0946100.1 unnamed protein product [Adineta steineri]
MLFTANILTPSPLLLSIDVNHFAADPTAQLISLLIPSSSSISSSLSSITIDKPATTSSPILSPSTS